MTNQAAERKPEPSAYLILLGLIGSVTVVLVSRFASGLPHPAGFIAPQALLILVTLVLIFQILKYSGKKISRVNLPSASPMAIISISIIPSIIYALHITSDYNISYVRYAYFALFVTRLSP